MQTRTPIREELIQLLSLSGTLAGLCITGVTFFYAMSKSSYLGSIADDMLAISALIFLICSYVIFVALRTTRIHLALALERAANVLFTVGLSLMVVTGLVMVYTVW